MNKNWRKEDIEDDNQFPVKNDIHHIMRNLNLTTVNIVQLIKYMLFSMSDIQLAIL